MSNEMTVAAPSDVAKRPVPMTGEIHPTTIDVSVGGDDNEAIAQGHASLTAWCERKVAMEKADHAELTGAYEHAKAKKWKVSTLQAAANRAGLRVRYYEKMLAAFRAGFIMVPNFPMTIFAIRTNRKGPKRWFTEYRHERFKQEPVSLPEGSGEYQNPIPLALQQTQQVKAPDGSVKDKVSYFPTDDWDELEFPMSMAKPHVMELVDRAMALKIFDEIGILPEQRAKGDPIIAGVIKRKEGYTTHAVTFLLAWHVDTRTL